MQFFYSVYPDLCDYVNGMPGGMHTSFSNIQRILIYENIILKHVTLIFTARLPNDHARGENYS
jgi:hypothetical protein